MKMFRFKSYLFASLYVLFSPFWYGCSKKDDPKANKGSLSIYSSSLSNGYIDIKVDDFNAEAQRLNTNVLGSFVPECGANTTVTLELSAGKHTLFLFNGKNNQTRDYTVLADSCQMIKINF